MSCVAFGGQALCSVWPLVDRLCVLCGCGGQAVCPVWPLVGRMCVLCGLWWTGCVSVWPLVDRVCVCVALWRCCFDGKQSVGCRQVDIGMMMALDTLEIYRSLWVSEVDDSHTTV